MTTTRSPGLSVCGVQPLRVSSRGLSTKASHVAEAPLPVGAVKRIRECGLVHWDSVMVAFKVVTTVGSKATLPWWAAARRTTPSNAANMAAPAKILLLIGFTSQATGHPGKRITRNRAEAEIRRDFLCARSPGVSLLRRGVSTPQPSDAGRLRLVLCRY